MSTSRVRMARCAAAMSWSSRRLPMACSPWSRASPPTTVSWSRVASCSTTRSSFTTSDAVTRKKSFALAGSVVVAIAIGLIDLITGSEVSVALFYLVPIALATWYVGPRAGLLSCLFVIAVRVADNWIEGHHFSHPVTPYWNTGIELGFFLVATSLLTRLHAAL